MRKTIRSGDFDYIDPSLFSFTAAAKEKVQNLRSAFPGKTISFHWARSMKQHGKGGQVTELGDMLVVGLGTPEESEPDFATDLDGERIEISIPVDVTAADAPVIDADEHGKLVLRR